MRRALLPVGRRITLGPRTLAQDSFNRPDSTVSPGTADSGQTWVELVSSSGIIGNQFYATSNSATVAYLECGQADMHATVKIAALTGSAQGIAARLIDTAHMWRFIGGATSSTLWLYNGSNTQEITGMPGFVAGDTIGLKCQGNVITCYINGVQVGQTTNAANNTGTKVALVASVTASRFDDLLVITP